MSRWWREERAFDDNAYRKAKDVLNDIEDPETVRKLSQQRLSPERQRAMDEHLKDMGASDGT